MEKEPSRRGDQSILYVTPTTAQAERFSQEMCRETEFDVLTFDTVNDALRTLDSRDDIACIVSDYDLPDIDGLAFLQAVRAQYADMPFILFTSEGNEAVTSKAIAGRVTDYLIKERFQDQWAELASLIEHSIIYHQSQQSLANPEVREKLILEASPEPIAVLQDNQFRYANSKALSLFEVETDEELADMRVEDVVADDDQTKTMSSIETLQAGHALVTRLDTSFLGQQGTETPVELTAISVKWNGTPAILLISRNITKRQEQKIELRRFNQAVQAAGHAIYITDTDGIIEYVNPAFEELTGFSQAEVVGETPRVLDAGGMTDQYFDELWDTVCSGDVWEEEITNQRKNGERYTARQTIAPVTDGDDIHAFVAIQDDITERKEREETLTRRTETIDEAPVGISISDPDQEDNPLIYVNNAFVEMTGYPRDEALGENCRFLQGENTDPDRVASIREAIDAEEPVSVTLRNYRKDGTEFWNHVEIAPVTNDASEVVNYIGFQQNVTERKQRQEQLAVLDRVLRHNLRNDMNVIRGQAEVIHSEATSEIAAAAEKIVEVSDQLLELAEKEREITELLRHEPNQKEIEICDRIQQIASRVESDHPEATITVDCSEEVTSRETAEFGQAIKELVTNAIVHNDSSSPEVALTVTQADETVRIDIADTGPRMPEMERNVLVDEREQTPLYHGGGLGLWLVNLIVTRSNGTITVEENTPTGNIVSVKLAH